MSYKIFFYIDFYCLEGYHFHDKGEDCSAYSKCHTNSNKRREGENLYLNAWGVLFVCFLCFLLFL